MGKIEERVYAAVVLTLWVVYWSIPVVGILVAALAAVDLILK